MKILCTADLHIHDHTAFSKYDDRGVPDRLEAYIKLADDILKTADENNADAIVLAGDISHAAITKPMVTNTIKDFLERISNNQDRNLIVTIGQHDCDTKSQIFNPIHSIVNSLIPKKDNVFYVNSPETFQMKGINIHVRPWQQGEIDYDDFEDADLFIGHGLVSGSSDAFGYMFKTGFDKDALMDKYRLSVIGDIHHGQVFCEEAKKGKILIPGSPIQNSFKDDPNCGLWIAELIEDSDAKLEFIPTKSIRDDGTYHQFIYIDDADNESDVAHVHTRMKSVKVKKTKDSNDDDYDDDQLDVDDKEILNIAIDVCNELKHSDPELCKNLLNEAYEKSNFVTSSMPSELNLIDINIQNFLSIQELSINLSDLSGDILIYGQNGSGKTSFVEAIFYLITGKTTKKILVESICNNAAKNKSFSVSGTIQISGEKYRIERGRSGEGPFLNLFKCEENAEVELNQATSNHTQEYIKKLIGLSSNDILTLAYFSTEKLCLFGDLTASDKHDFLGKLVNLEHIETLRLNMSDLHENYKKKFLQEDTVMNELEKSISFKKDKIERNKDRASEVPPRSHIDAGASKFIAGISESMSIMSIKQDLRTLKLEHESKFDSSISERYNALIETRNTLSSDNRFLSQEVDTLNAEIKKAKSDMDRASSGKCPTCEQSLTNDDLIKSFSEKLSGAEGKIKLKNEELVANQESTNVLEGKIKSSEQSKYENDLLQEKIHSMSKVLEDIEVYFQKTNIDKNEIEDDLLKKEIEELTEKKASIEGIVKSLQDSSEISKWILTKVLNRSGKVVSKLTGKACKMLEAHVNNLVSNPEIFAMEITPSKNIDVMISFRGNKKRPNVRMFRRREESR